MKIALRRFDLPLEHPFTIARGSITHQPSLVVQLERDGHIGLGEVTENSFYGHTIDSMSRSLEGVRSLLENTSDPADEHWPASFWSRSIEVLRDDRFALSALDIAVHDLSSRIRGVPLYRAWGLNWENVPASSYTIGIAPIEQMIAKLNERPDWSIYKIKLGTPNDLEIVRRLRERTEATLRVDANCGWSCEETIVNSAALSKLGVEFIEQPLPPDAPESDKERVFAESALPIIADEDCQIESDVERCSQYFHGINVKLCKCGGLTPALAMLRQARDIGMRTMVGCMIESSVGISAAAHLLPLLDYADLDGATLLRDDPAEGVMIDRGMVTPTNRSGSGARLTT